MASFLITEGGGVVMEVEDDDGIVENKECEEVKTMEEVVVSPPKGTEEKTKDESSKVNPIELPSPEEETKIDEVKPKVAEPEEKGEEKLETGDSPASLAEPEDKPKFEDMTAPPAQADDKVEVKPKAEDSTPPPPEPEDKVGDKKTETCQDKGEVSSDVAEHVAESVEMKSEKKIDIGSSKNDAIEENTEELTNKSTDVPESSVDTVVIEDKEVKEVLREKETEAAAETSEVEHTKEIIPAVIEEPEKDAADIVAKEVEVEVAKSKETYAEKVDGVGVSNERTKDAVEEPEREVETSDEKIQKAGETIKPATEEVAEAINSTEKSDERANTSKDIQVKDVSVVKSKQSNNILSRLKQSFVKAKKAIIGKSPNSKTPSSETKAEIKA